MDEVCDSKTRPTLEVTPNLERAIVLPLEGKGDRSAVDEVNMSPAPLRGALWTKILNAGQFEDLLQLCYPVSGLWSLAFSFGILKL